jgi:MFS family permease
MTASLAYVALITTGLGLCQSTSEVYVIIVLMPLGMGLSPALNALYAVEVAPSDQGRLQGAMSCVMTLAYIPGGALYTWLYDDTVNDNYSHGSYETVHDMATSSIWFLTGGLFLSCALLGFFLEDHPQEDVVAFATNKDGERQKLLEGQR